MYNRNREGKKIRISGLWKTRDSEFVNSFLPFKQSKQKGKQSEFC